MKNFLKFLAMAGFAALMAFSFASCGDGAGSGEPPKTFVITIDIQPIDVIYMTAGDSESLFLEASVSNDALLSYQWYGNIYPSNEGGTPMSGATGATFNIPVDYPEATYYFYCVISAEGAVSVRSGVVTVVISSKKTLKASDFLVSDNVKEYNRLSEGVTVEYDDAEITEEIAGIISFFYVDADGIPNTKAPINAGIYEIKVTTVNGSDYHSISIPLKVGDLTIEPKPITITGAVIASKPHDGTTAIPPANVTPEFGNVIAGDTITFTISDAAYTDNANVGNNKPTTFTVTLTGISAINYSLNSPTYKNATANITDGNGNSGDTGIGAGTAVNPFLVRNETEMRRVGGGTANPTGYTGWLLDSYYKLDSDITLTGIWEPIGNTPAGQFAGVFDGNNKTITINGFTANPVYLNFGIFGKTSGAVIKNLKINVAGNIIVNIDYTASGNASNQSQVGVLVGRADSATVIDNISISGSGSLNATFNISAANGRFRVGGIAGMIWEPTSIPGPARISNSTVSLNINAEITGPYVADLSSPTGARASAGGIVGYTQQEDSLTTEYTSVDNCHFTGSVYSKGTQRGFAGGITGEQLFYSVISNSSASGNISGGGPLIVVGGIVGRQDQNSRIYRCYFKDGFVLAEGDNSRAIAGGISGESFKPNTVIEECYSSAVVQAYSKNQYASAGGIVGNNNGIVRNCFSAGNVHGSSSYDVDLSTVGGIAGANWWDNGNGGRISNCYALGKITAGDGVQLTSDYFVGGIAGLNDFEIKQCAALNEDVRNYGNGVWARVGVGYGSTFTNNVSIGTGINEPNGLDGQGYAASTFVKNAAIYSSTLNWNFSTIWKWSTASYAYPILAWMPANSNPAFDSGIGGPPIFTLTNISFIQQSEGSEFFIFGIFPVGTSKANVETDAERARTESQPPDYVVAYAGGLSDGLPFTALDTNSASISSTLTSAITEAVWNGAGTYDGWVCLYNGSVWTSYKTNSAIVVNGDVNKSAQADFTKQ